MEDSWENWISSLEMGDDKSNGHQPHHINSLLDHDRDQDKLLTGIALEPPPTNFSFQNHHSSSTATMPYNNNNHNNSDYYYNFNAFPTTSTIGSTSTSLSYEDHVTERHGEMLKCNSSNSINISQTPPSSSTFILSFENSTMEAATTNNNDNENNNSNYPNKHFEAFDACSSLLSSEVSLTATKPKAKQGGGANKKYRSSSEIKDHIMAERKRRQELTERFIALSATIPGLKKTDKAYILQEAITYMKQLQERVKELENQNKRKATNSRIFIKKSSHVVCSSREEEDQEATSCETNNSYNRSTPPSLLSLPQVEARVLDKEVLIGIHCQKQKDIVLKIMALLQNLHLSLSSSSVLPFGTSTLKVTIIAQMGDKYCMTMNDLVKSLRQDLLKSHDIQESYSQECHI